MTESSNDNLVQLVNGMRMLLMNLAMQEEVFKENQEVIDALWLSTTILEEDYCTDNKKVMSLEEIIEKMQIEMLEDMYNKEEDDLCG